MSDNSVSEVASFLSQSPLKSFVGGKWIEAADGSTFITKDPGSGEQLAEVTALSAADVDLAVQAADKAFRTTGWAELPPNERGVMLHRLADAIEQQIDTFARIESLMRGKFWNKPWATSRTLLTRCDTSLKSLCIHNAARRLLFPGLMLPLFACLGDHVDSSFLGTSRSCSSAGELHQL